VSWAANVLSNIFFFTLALRLATLDPRRPLTRAPAQGASFDSSWDGRPDLAGLFASRFAIAPRETVGLAY
jgi:hypothetical protein